MKRIALILISFPAAAVGDDPFACVDPEVADAFLGNPYSGRPAYSTDLPDAFTGLQVPESFSLIGSEINRQHVRAVYKTTDSAEAALSAAVDRIAGDEWHKLADYTDMPRGGFQTRVPALTATFCRDTEPGFLTINASAVQDRTFLHYSINNYNPGQTCSALVSRSALAGRSPMGHWNKLPVLELPEDVESTNSGMGSNGNEYYSSVIVKGGMSRDSLVSYLGDQIRNQGWTFDTGWSGSFSAGSIWSKISPEGETMIGILNAYGESRKTYQVRIGASPAKTSQMSNFGMIGNVAVQPN